MVHTLLELHLLQFAWVCGGQAHTSELPQGTADVWLQGRVLLGKVVAFQQGICILGELEEACAVSFSLALAERCTG